MECKFINIKKSSFSDALKIWKQKNNSKYMSEFIDSLGLVYKRIYNNDYRFEIVDEKLYMLMKIKYGF